MIYDQIILGAGLAGLSLADSLTARNQSVLVLDTQGIGSGASGTPIGLVNPATGRRGKKVWRIEQALPAIHDALHSASSYSDHPFYVRKGVLRPSRDQEMAADMHKRYKRASWPAGWCYWMTEKEIKKFHDGIECVDGGLWLPVGMAVYVPGYLVALKKKISERGGKVVTRPSYTFNKTSQDRWILTTDRGEKITGNRLIFATGAGVLKERVWNNLPLSAVKGQIAEFSVEESLNFDHSISSKGYIAHIGNGELVVGSTYEHDYEEVQPTDKGEKNLRNILRGILPELSRRVSLKRRWAGLRVSAGDHKPVVGRHPAYHGLYLFTGLGSKGLLHGKYLAEQLAHHILEGRRLPDKAAIGRYEHLLQ